MEGVAACGHVLCRGPRGFWVLTLICADAHLQSHFNTGAECDSAMLEIVDPMLQVSYTRGLIVSSSRQPRDELSGVSFHHNLTSALARDTQI